MGGAWERGRLGNRGGLGMVTLVRAKALLITYHIRRKIQVVPLSAVPKPPPFPSLPGDSLSIPYPGISCTFTHELSN